MSLSKQKNFSEEELDQIFYALSDFTRRSLLKTLADGPEKITSLAEPFHMSLQAVSKHIKILESAKLIKREIDGRVHKCSIEPDTIDVAEYFLIKFKSFLNRKLVTIKKTVK